MAIETNKKMENVIWINKDQWYKEGMRNTSHSQVENYSSCSLKWALQKVFKVPEGWSEKLAFGNVHHTCIEAFLKHQMKTKSTDRDEYLNLLYPIWHESFANEFKDSTLDPGEFLEMQSMSKASIPTIVDYFLQAGYEVVNVKDNNGNIIPAIELGIATPIENPITKKAREDYYLLMFIDAIVRDKQGRIMILDHKTSAKRYSDSKLETSNQLPLYVYGTTQLFKDNGLKYDNLVGYDVFLKQKKLAIEPYEKYVEYKDIERMLVNVNMALDGMSKKCYCPSTLDMAHNFCSYYDTCFKNSENGEVNLKNIYRFMMENSVELEDNMEANNVTRPVTGTNNIQEEKSGGEPDGSTLLDW